MIPTNFKYKKASSVSQAIKLLAKHGDDAKIMSGGHSLIPAMKLRLNAPEMVIDIKSIKGLDRIRETEKYIKIGANVTHYQIATSDLVKAKLSVLGQTAKTIGDTQVRYRGTIGGSLAHSDPAADYPATVLATDAIIIVKGPNGKRKIPATEFFQGIFTTALAEDEIITQVNFPKNSHGTYVKFFQPASRFAVVGIAVVKDGDNVKVGVTGVADTPYRASAVEAAWNGNNASDAAAHVVDGVEAMGDHFASSEYRAHLAKVFTGKALDAVSIPAVVDNLTKVEGIGPKIAEIFNGKGITSFEALANTSVDDLKAMLVAAGNRFARHNPGTWPAQARLAADGKWDELKKWQDELDGGK